MKLCIDCKKRYGGFWGSERQTYKDRGKIGKSFISLFIMKNYRASDWTIDEEALKITPIDERLDLILSCQEIMLWSEKNSKIILKLLPQKHKLAFILKALESCSYRNIFKSLSPKYLMELMTSTLSKKDSIIFVKEAYLNGYELLHDHVINWDIFTHLIDSLHDENMSKLFELSKPEGDSLMLHFLKNAPKNVPHLIEFLAKVNKLGLL